MDSRSRGLTAKAENDNRRVACHPWGRGVRALARRTATRGSIHKQFSINLHTFYSTLDSCVLSCRTTSVVYNY